MALRMPHRSWRRADSLARTMDCWYAGTLIPARMAIIAITIMSSTSVNPRCPAVLLKFRSIFIHLPRVPPGSSPGVVLRAIEPGAGSLGIHVKNVRAIPATGVWSIMDGVQSPVIVPGHRVDGDTAEKTHFLPLHIHAFDHGVEIRRIPFCTELDHECPTVSGILIAVDRVTHLPQRAVKLAFFLAPDADTRHRNSRTDQQQKNEHRHDQLDQRESLGFAQITLTAICLTTI